MSASVLSISEQRAAISGKKKKMKTIKNVLDIPSSLKVDSHYVNSSEGKKLKQLLESLLPLARLSTQQISSGNKVSKEEGLDKSHQTVELRSKRNQLSLGVNDLNRSIKKDSISAALLAADIQPKFLIHHLNLLCTHNKIPFLHMPELREVTKGSLGFPCIAVGFKKNFCDFLEVVEEIKLISQNKKNLSSNLSQEITDESSSEDYEKVEGTSKIHENSTNSNETLFKYLVRSSINERMFIPEKHYNHQTKTKSDFIVIQKDDDDSDYDTKFKKVSPQLGISNKSCKKQKIKLKNLSDLESTDDCDEDLEVSKKKLKKEWCIDKVGNRKNIRYYLTNLVRVPSNPGRTRRK